MVRIDVLFLLLGMMLVTYVPRLLPALFIGRFRFRGRVEKFLRLIPYTAMAALIFPGVLSVDAEHFWIGLVGVGVAGVLAYLKCPMTFAVLSAIGANLLIYAVIL